MSDHYTVTYSTMALEDLRDIYEYIRYTLIAPIAGEHQILRIRKMIASLDMFPMRHMLVDEEPWKSKMIYKVPVDKYVVFYCVDDIIKLVSIVRIFYAARDIENLINYLDT